MTGTVIGIAVTVVAVIGFVVWNSIRNKESGVMEAEHERLADHAESIEFINEEVLKIDAEPEPDLDSVDGARDYLSRGGVPEEDTDQR